MDAEVLFTEWGHGELAARIDGMAPTLCQGAILLVQVDEFTSNLSQRIKLRCKGCKAAIELLGTWRAAGPGHVNINLSLAPGPDQAGPMVSGTDPIEEQ